MADTKKLQRRRVALYQQQGGKCFWCHESMRLLSIKDGPFPDDLCTIDHLRDRYHPGRQAIAKGEARYVAACRSCNQRRGRESHILHTATA